MKELSIFIDESGDFGNYESHSPFYLFTILLHEQQNKINHQIEELEEKLRRTGIESKHCFHSGPIIRREEEYENLSLEERRSLFNKILVFTKKIDISYVTFSVDKRNISNSSDLSTTLKKLLSSFIKSEYDYFIKFDKIIVYYDNGQVELNKLLASIFTVMLSNVEFRKVLPAEYRLFQVADMICTLELISLKEKI